MGQFEDEFGLSDRGYRPPVRRTFGNTVAGPPCPTCGGRGSTVSDSRPTPKGVRRRRTCTTPSCPRWTTFETNHDPEQFKILSAGDRTKIETILKLAEGLKKSLNL